MTAKHLFLWTLALSFSCSNAIVCAQEGSSRAESAKMSARIDSLLNERMRETGWPAAEDCSDAAFIRRSYLDLTGTPPTATEVLDFLKNESSDKDTRLLDRLLGTQACAAHLAETWAGWMLPEDNNPQLLAGRSGLQVWLRSRFAENLRYDRLVADLLVASGSAQNGPTSYFVALEGKPEKIAAKTARVFMGVQLDCAECHDHPFDDWSQRDFWGFAAYFAQLSTGPEPGMRAGGGLTDLDEGEVKLPGTEEVIPPKALVKTGLSGIGSGTRRQQLTLWLTARENPFLARATVNRIWAILFGRGLIEPIDDMRSLEMASHPQLLRELSEYFAATGYDLRKLIRTLVGTKAYRRNTLHPSGPAPPETFATMATKPLTQSQLSSMLAHVARQIASDESVGAQAALAAQLGQLRGAASEANLGIVSALVALHGQAFDQASRDGSSRLLKALEAPYLDERKQLRWLFLSTLGRLPSAEEQSAFSELFDGDNDDSTWQSDLLWALVNSTEFAMTP